MSTKPLTDEDVKKISEMNRLKGKELFKSLSINYLENVRDNKEKLKKELPGIELIYRTFKELSSIANLEETTKSHIDKELKEKLDILIATKNLIEKSEDIINELEKDNNVVDWILNNYDNMVKLQYILNIPVGLTESYDIELERKAKLEKEITEE